MRKPAATRLIGGNRIKALLAMLLLPRRGGCVAAGTVAREEIDTKGYKYKVPNEKWLGTKEKTEEIKTRRNVRQVLNGEYSINEPAIKLKFREYYQKYLFPLMTTEEGLRTIVKDR